MARKVFFSFHYQRDIWRVNQIRSVPNIIGSAAAGFLDASLWEEAANKSPSDVERLIDNGLHGTSVTVVFIGARTAGRRFIDYEISKSLERGNGIVGIQIHHLKDKNGQFDSLGEIPTKLKTNNIKIYKYLDMDKLAQWIEEAAKDAGK